MKFCPKCGNLLVPLRRDNKTVLKCRVCGYEEDVKVARAEEGYKLTHSIQEEKRVKTSKVSEEAGKPLRREEEREILQEYYEVFLESFSEEESSSEESS